VKTFNYQYIKLTKYTQSIFSEVPLKCLTPNNLNIILVFIVRHENNDMRYLDRKRWS